MSEQRIDFLKIKMMIGKCTPEQLGSLFRQYYDKHLKDIPEPVYVSKDSSLLDIFDGNPLPFPTA